MYIMGYSMIYYSASYYTIICVAGAGQVRNVVHLGVAQTVSHAYIYGTHIYLSLSIYIYIHTEREM